MERNASISNWPAFRQLYALFASRGHTFETSPEEFDALASLLQLLNAEPDLPDYVFDGILDVVLAKIGGKGGAGCDAAQIPDVAYEGQVALLLARFLPGWAKIEAEEASRPDHVLTIYFHLSELPTRVAIECKNVRSHHEDLRTLITSVARAIRKAARQHEPRKDDFADLLIFVDLPIGFLSRPTTDYYALIVNVWRSLSRMGLDWIEESQVIFTATGQKDMADHLLEERPEHRNITLLAPMASGKTEVSVRAPRLFFLSALFRKPGESINTENWSRVAVTITDPEQYVVDLRKGNLRPTG